MKRHEALKSLSREHHGALVLALACARAAESNNADQIGMTCQRVIERFESDLEPHFCVEESTLLPRLTLAGRDELVRRTLDEHTLLRSLRDLLASGDTACLADFGIALSRHVRFEEKELFHAVEKTLPEEV